MITASTLVNNTLTVVIDNGKQILSARNDHPKWTEIVQAFKDMNEDKLLELFSMKRVVERFSTGQVTVADNVVLFNNHPLHGIDVDRLLGFLKEGLPYSSIANYIQRKMLNPSQRAVEEMYKFLEHKNMPLTPEGKIIAYKGVGNDFWSLTGNLQTVVIQGKTDASGRIFNEIGATIEVQRNCVDDNYKNHCSKGLHAGSLMYARGFGPKIILVEIDPADVVSVPDDCECQKLRCCKYKVIGEYTGPLPNYYTDEFHVNRTENDYDEDWDNDYDDTPDDLDTDYNVNPDRDETPINVVFNKDKGWLEEKVEIEDKNFVSTGGLVDTIEKLELEREKAEHDRMVSEGGKDVPFDSYTNTLNRVKQRIVDLIGFVSNSFEPSYCLGSPELNFDELDIVEFIMMLEEEFNIEISDEDSEKYFKFESQVKDIADYIDAKIHGIVPSPEDVAEAKSLVEFIQTHPMSEPPVQFVTPQQAVQKDLDDYNRGYEVGYKKGIKDGIAHSWRAHNESEINSSNFKRKNSYNQGFVVGYNKGYRCGRSDYKHK